MFPFIRCDISLNLVGNIRNASSIALGYGQDVAVLSSPATFRESPFRATQKRNLLFLSLQHSVFGHFDWRLGGEANLRAAQGYCAPYGGEL